MTIRRLRKRMETLMRNFATWRVGPVPIPQSGGLSFPANPLLLFQSGLGVAPVLTAADTYRTEVVGTNGGGGGISRVHWEVEKAFGETFSLAATITYDAGFRGTILRLEDFWAQSEQSQPFYPGMHRLELDRWGDGTWNVVRNRIKSTVGPDEDVQLLGSYAIASGAKVELRGHLSPIDGQALTQLYVDGSLVGSTTTHNWSDDQSTLATRARFGIVEGSLIVADCRVSTSGMSYQ